MTLAFKAYQSGSQSVAGANVAADRFLGLIEKADYTGADAMLAAGTRKTASASSITDVMSVLQKRRGQAASHTGPTNYYIGNYNGITQVRLTYQEMFKKGTVTPVQLVLTPEDGIWKVVSFDFTF